mmetsp:Transcript_13402/g.14940  ORF Transcript_13402/g.14940 Transcript_13402/m.14940 type:complete len:160 (+) Transcript_13402:79-558(+)
MQCVRSSIELHNGFRSRKESSRTYHVSSLRQGDENRRPRSNSENIGAQGNYTKISRNQCGRTTVYYRRIQDQNKRHRDVEHTKVERMAKDPITWAKERMEYGDGQTHLSEDRKGIEECNPRIQQAIRKRPTGQKYNDKELNEAIPDAGGYGYPYTLVQT